MFSRDLSAEDIAFLCADKPVDMESFYALYVNIMALSAEGYDAGNTGGTPELTVTLQKTDDSESVRVDFVKRDDLSYFLVVNGVEKPFYVLARKVDLVKWWCNKLLEAL